MNEDVMLGNTRESYGLIAQLLHWLTAALIVVLLALGVYMHDLPAGTSVEAATKFWYYSLHKTLGVSAFLVAVIRVVWAVVHPRPKPLNGHRPLESLVASTVHWALYGAIILMPLTGWSHHSATAGFAPIWWPLPQDLPLIPKGPALAALFATAHYLIAVLLSSCICLHIIGALKHALVDRDGTIRRMVPGIAIEKSANVAPRPFERISLVLALFAFLSVGTATIIVAPPPKQLAPPSKLAATETSAGWRVDPQMSRIGIQITQSGSTVTGSFRSWSARINLDPDNLDRARISIEIDVVSLSLGDVSEQAVSADFLDSGAFPVARFISRNITRSAVDTYNAEGQLTLAGKTRPVRLPVRLTITDDHASATGEVELNRLAFGVGARGFPDDSLVGIAVLVQIKVEADRVTSAK